MSTITFTEEQIKEIILKETEELLRETLIYASMYPDDETLQLENVGEAAKENALELLDGSMRYIKNNDAAIDMLGTALAYMTSKVPALKVRRIDAKIMAGLAAKDLVIGDYIGFVLNSLYFGPAAYSMLSATVRLMKGRSLFALAFTTQGRNVLKSGARMAFRLRDLRKTGAIKEVRTAEGTVAFHKGLVAQHQAVKAGRAIPPRDGYVYKGKVFKPDAPAPTSGKPTSKDLDTAYAAGTEEYGKISAYDQEVADAYKALDDFFSGKTSVPFKKGATLGSVDAYLTSVSGTIKFMDKLYIPSLKAMPVIINQIGQMLLIFAYAGYEDSSEYRWVEEAIGPGTAQQLRNLITSTPGSKGYPDAYAHINKVLGDVGMGVPAAIFSMVRQSGKAVSAVSALASLTKSPEMAQIRASYKDAYNITLPEGCIPSKRVGVAQGEKGIRTLKFDEVAEIFGYEKPAQLAADLGLKTQEDIKEYMRGRNRPVDDGGGFHAPPSIISPARMREIEAKVQKRKAEREKEKEEREKKKKEGTG